MIPLKFRLLHIWNTMDHLHLHLVLIGNISVEEVIDITEKDIITDTVKGPVEPLVVNQKEQIIIIISQ